MSIKNPKILYENQEEVWSKAKHYLKRLVSKEKCVAEAIVWASLAEGSFGTYKSSHKGRTASDIDLVIIINEKHSIPNSWKFTNVKKSCFDLYHIGKYKHKNYVHEIDGLLVFPSRHDLKEVRNMLSNRSKSIYLQTGTGILENE